MKRLGGTAGPRKAKRRALESWAATRLQALGQLVRPGYRGCWTTRGGTWLRWPGSLRGYDVDGWRHDGRRVVR